MKKVLYTSLSAIGLLLLNVTAHAQQSVGIGTNIPDNSARLEIAATNKGLLIPRVSLTTLTDNATISAPATSLLVYNTNATVGVGYYFNSGTPASPVWKKLLNTGDAGGASGWGLTGNAGTTTANFLGTTDAQPIRFRINNFKAGYFSRSNIFMGDSAAVVARENFTAANVGIGFKALQNADSTSYNVAIGAYAMYQNTIDQSTVAIGDFSLFDNDDYYGGGNVNTGVGSNALSYNIDGYYNTGVGGYTMIDNYSGAGNTAVGFFANCFDTLGQVDVNNSTAIGAGALADVDDMVRIGDENVSQIGGAVDWSVISDGRFKKDIKNENGGLDFIMQLRPVNYHYNIQKMVDAKINQLKTRNRSNQNGRGEDLDKVLAKYNSPAYRKKIATSEGRLYNGFIAQEVETAANNVGYNFSGVVKPSKPGGRYALRYATFVVPLIEAVQEQQKTIEAQNIRLENLEKRLLLLEQK
ncbi:tail fiber domain-containing protein [Ferruginibacter sp. SUN002]|uniref:tail fiber domain-containing protein n=1 Tax=Ferruginibacter sp. SUN002 TaxID=2937789 RepID=UPI003D36BC0D